MIWKFKNFIGIILVFIFIFLGFDFKAYGIETMIKVGFEPKLPPYQFLEDGQPAGVHIDILDSIASKNNFIIKYIPMETTTKCIESLNSGNVDMVLGVNKNDNSRYKVWFTETISQSYICIVAPSNESYKILNDIITKGLVASIQSNTMEYSYIQNLFNLRYVLVPNQVQAFDLLVNNKVDLLIGVKHSIIYQLEKAELLNEFTIINNYLSFIEYNIAVKEGNKELLKKVNEGIQQLKLSGKYEKIREKWINENENIIKEVIRNITYIIGIILVIILVVFIFNFRLNILLKRQVEEKTKELKLINNDLHNQIIQTRNHNELKNCIVENSPSSIVVFDKDYLITLYNHNMLNLLETMDSLIGKSIVEMQFFYNILSDKIEKVFNKDIKFTNKEIILKDKYGEKVIYRYSIYQLYSSDGNVRGAILMIDDVTEENKIKERIYEKEKNIALNQIIAGIAHEIRNPLTSIKNFVEMMPIKKDNEKFQNRLYHIVPKEVDRVNNLINNLIEYARPNIYNKEKTDVGNLINSTIELMEHTLLKYNITLNIKVEDGLLILSDINKMKQVLINIILNAAESILLVKSCNGVLYIDIQAWQNGKGVFIQVIDEGIGMTDEEIKRCTESFYTTKAGGTGLGLYVSKQYVEDNNGIMEIESVKGVYTKITLRFEGIRNEKVYFNN